jgi:lipopolysaccharide transport system ATP-binding protein
MGIVVRVQDVSKEYRLGVINNGRLYADIQSAWAKLLGREDPHSVIGEQGRFGRRGSFWALEDVSFDVTQGQRIGIMGRNGAGKSTLLKILSRITAPTKGCVKIKGRMASLLEVGTGFHPELTGRENTYLNGAILGMKKREVARKFDEIVAFSEIEPFIDTPVKRYSSGMFVRLAFAVAAHLDAEIIVADEVLAVGDVKFQEKCLGKMQDVSVNEGRTVLFVSHNSGAVERLCNVGVLLEQGRIVDYQLNVAAVIAGYNKMIGI